MRIAAALLVLLGVGLGLAQDKKDKPKEAPVVKPREGKAETILFNLCGHGHFDMQAYMDYFSGKLKDIPYDERELKRSLDALPKVAAE